MRTSLFLAVTMVGIGCLGCGGSGSGQGPSDQVEQRGDMQADGVLPDLRTLDTKPDQSVPDVAPDDLADLLPDLPPPVDADALPDFADEPVPVDAEDATDTGPVEDPGCAVLYGDGWAFNPSATSGDGCKNCNGKVDCDIPGSLGLYHRTTLAGQCVCKTMPGYFFSNTIMSVLPCDRDKDGWVTVTAQDFVETTDQALHDNARCAVMEPETIIYHPDESDTPDTVEDVEGLSLYEPNARDDAVAMGLDPNLVPFGPGGRLLLPEELNSLTKGCVSRTADFNGNGVSDITETPVSSGIYSEMKAYAKYAFFLELYTSWYDPEQKVLHIVERPRDPNADELGVSIGFDSLPDGWWRQCTRATDWLYDPQKPVTGMDLAGVEGMHHHSQYKCLEVVKENEVSANQPHKVTAVTLLDHFQPSSCAATEEPQGEYYPLVPNPRDVFYDCINVDSANQGDVLWGIVRHMHYEYPGEYQQGCVNPCVEGWPGLSTCPGYPIGHAACTSDSGDFDRPSCTCTPVYEGENCDLCHGHWSGELCDYCPAPWVGPGCDQCPGNWTGPTCEVCPAPWTGTACDKCIGHYDEATACTTCDASAAEGHWSGASCNQCDPHFKGVTCTECSNHWTGANCDVCPAGPTEGFWDPASNCSACQAHRATGTFTSANLFDWAQAQDCGTDYCWHLASSNVDGASMFAYTNTSLSLDFPWGSSFGYASPSVTIPVTNFYHFFGNTSYDKIMLSLNIGSLDCGDNISAHVQLLDRNKVNLGPEKTLSCTDYNLWPPDCDFTDPYAQCQSTCGAIEPLSMDVTSYRSSIGYVKIWFWQVYSTTYPNYYNQYGGLNARFTATSSSLTTCGTCVAGWTDDPASAGTDCLLCPTGDVGNWALTGGECIACQNDSGGHFTGTNCDQCMAGWSPPPATSNGVGCFQQM